MCVLCVVCCGVLLCVCRYVLCWCWWWCAMCGALCALCALCVCCVCGVSVVCVARLDTRKTPPCVCSKTSPCVGFKTHPCVPAKRPHVERVCRHTRRHFEPTHRDVLSIHTGRREGRRGGGGGGERGKRRGFSSLSLSLFSSLFLSSVVLFLFSPSLLSFCLSSLSNNDNDHSSSRALSLCAHTALTCQRVRVPVL